MLQGLRGRFLYGSVVLVLSAPREAGERQLPITLFSGLFRAHGGARMAQDGRGALVLVAAPFSTGARLLNI